EFPGHREREGVAGGGQPAQGGDLMRTRDWVNKRQTQGSLTGDGLRGRWSGPSGVECDVYFLLGGMKWALTYPGLALVETGAVKRANIETKPRRKTAVNNVVIDFLA